MQCPKPQCTSGYVFWSLFVAKKERVEFGEALLVSLSKKNETKKSNEF